MTFRIKRFLDISIVTVFSPLWLPLILLLSSLIVFFDGLPVFFKQERAGKNGRPFTIIKFRTLSSETDKNGHLLPDEERLTKLGKLLRKLSLDELPELLNVIKGRMSLVGPRPLLFEYVDYYTLEQARRLDVLPGITGWAQIKGRNVLTWEERFKLDVWYVENQSIMLDLRILISTIIQVISCKGISHPGSATMHKFNPKTGGKS